MNSATGLDPLAEWSQKIKHLQQQVDEDGLQEQARLEAEIAKSRMERANRRSTLTGNARIDQAAVTYLSKLPEPRPTQEPRADALLRLHGVSEPSEQPVDAPHSSTHPLRDSTSQAPSKAMSLAEFMGGRAAGPRLNKHAPQAAYEEHLADYEARNKAGAKSVLRQVSNPSPVPSHGLAKDPPQGVSSTPARSYTSTPSQSLGNSTQQASPLFSSTARKADHSQIPAATRTFLEGKAQNSVTSTPPPSDAEKPVFRKDTSPPSMPVTNAAKPPTSPSPASPPSWASPSSPEPPRWTSPTSPALPKSSPAGNPSPSASSPRIEMLARPLQPSPSPVQRFIPPTNPSPAFLKPPPPKEERPSITRLQGRGFVEKQVKASERLSSTPEEVGKVHQPTPTEKKLSVLERWPGEGGKKPASPTPTTSTDLPRRELHRSLPSGGAGSGPSKVAAFVAATNEKNAPRARNTEHDSTPLRLPGMGGAGPPPPKSRSQPDAAKDSATSLDASLGPGPRRLPGLAVDMSTPSALKKASSSIDLRTPSKRRSVHFDDPKDDDSFTPKLAALDGNQTDAAHSKKLVHMTKDRARKPRKANAKTDPPIVTRSPDVVATPSEAPAPQGNVNETIPPEHVVKPSAEVFDPKLTGPVGTAVATAMHPSGTLLGDNAKIVFPTQPSSDAAPVTPVSARPPSGEGRPKVPPPIIPPKPAALRRNSLPTPTERNSPLFSRPRQDSSHLEKETQDTARSPIPSPMPAVEEEIPSTISVKAAASSWGKPASRQAPELEKPVVSQEIEAPKQSIGALGSSASNTPEPPEPPIVVPAVLNPPVIPMPQPRPRPLSQGSERRRSISDRYSAIILPPLKEEKTPTATPEGSLRIQATPVGRNVPSAQTLHDSLVSASFTREPSHQERPQSLEVVESTTPKANGHSPVSPLDQKVIIVHEDAPIPAFNLSRLLAPAPATSKLAPGAAISIESFVISGSSSTVIKENIHVFYDAEIMAIVYRGKNKSTGLVGTTVWAWIGSKASLGEKETTKLQDMASRFNTSLIQVPQGKEPHDLVQLLGGTIAIRHGSRAHWSPDNTALHCVRMHGNNLVMIEENELTSRNICSAFSYCLAILEALFVWHGRGALPTERAAAQVYAKAIASEGVKPTELEEGEGDDMFWMMLDEGGYANADYWRFRNQLPPHMSPSPRLWIVSDNALQPVIPFCANDVAKGSVFMYDGVFELFVIVGEEARGRRNDIRLAVAAAESVAAASAITRSFPPPTHVLIFPTRIPVDVRVNFRGMDYWEVGGLPPPNHINLLTLEEARNQLDQQEWTLRQLKDPQFLPLGISPSMHPDFSASP